MNKKRVLISCNMGIQHFYFAKSFLDEFNDKFEFYILFQSHLDKKISFFEKIKRQYKKAGLKGLINRFVNKNCYADIMNNEKNIFYKSFYPKIDIDYFYDKVSKNNIKLTHDINADEAISFIQRIKPDLFLLQGGKLIKNECLSEIKCSILHLHLGIVPLYRGGNSQFWAIYNNAIEENGFTIQSVDLGIDTGDIYIRKFVTDFSIDDNEHSMYCKTQVEGVEAIKNLIKYYITNDKLPVPIPVKEKGFNYGGNIMVESAKEYVYKNRKRVLFNYIKNKDKISNPIKEISVI